MIESIKEVIKGFHLIHGVIFLIVGVFNLWFWSRRRFWVPKYVHVMAGISFVIAILLGWMAFSLDRVSDPGRAIRVWILITVLFPTIVYFAFAFYGGVEAAYRSRILRSKGIESNNENKNKMS
jgi:hypothetical protein